MSFAGSVDMHQQEYGYHYVGDDYICPNCFDDHAIKEFIRNNASETKCSYCESQSRKPNSASLGNVIEFIMQGIYTEYADSEEELIPIDSLEYADSDEDNITYDYAEGGY